MAANKGFDLDEWGARQFLKIQDVPVVEEEALKTPKKKKKAVKVFSNQYLDWIYVKITWCSSIINGTFEGKLACNFIQLAFSNLDYLIVFSKKFLETKGINLEEIQIGKVLGIQPKVRGEILGTHMINSLELRNGMPRIWKHLRISVWKEIKGKVYVFFENRSHYTFNKGFLEYKGIDLTKRKGIKIKEIGGWIYDIK